MSRNTIEAILYDLFSVKHLLNILEISEELGTDCLEGRPLQTNHRISEAVYCQSRAKTKIKENKYECNCRGGGFVLLLK